jgi:hypothetical protein
MGILPEILHTVQMQVHCAEVCTENNGGHFNNVLICDHWTFLWLLSPLGPTCLSVQLSDYDNATYFLIHNYEAFVHQSFMCLRKRQEWWSIHINTESIYLLPLFLMRFITLNPPSQQMKHTDNTTLIQWKRFPNKESMLSTFYNTENLYNTLFLSCCMFYFNCIISDQK